MEPTKFNLFEIENLDIDDLIREFPGSIGKTDNHTRANVAMRMKKEERLADCPLSPLGDINVSRYDKELFFRILSSTKSEIKIICEELNPSLLDYIRDLLDDNHYKNRILCVYIIYSSLVRFKEIQIVGFSKMVNYLFEYVPYIDESYYMSIKNLSEEDLYQFLDSVLPKGLDSDLHRELATRLYDDVKLFENGELIEDLLLETLLNLKKLAIERKDAEMLLIIEDISIKYKSRFKGRFVNLYYNKNFLINPSSESAIMCLKMGYLTRLQMGEAALSMVLRTNPYNSFIDYEEYIEIMKNILRGENCERFLKEIGKKAKTDRTKRMIAATILRLCGKSSTMSQLVSKSMRMSHIPEGYYI